MNPIDSLKIRLEHIVKYTLLILGLISLYTLIFIVELSAMLLSGSKLPIVLILAVIVNVVLVFKVMNYGFRKLSGSTPLENTFSLIYGLVCYLCLIFQFGVLFYLYYFYANDTDVLTREFLQNLSNDRVGIAVKNPETIDITWFQGLLFVDRTKSVLQVLL